MCMALVSVTRKPSWREEYIRSAEKYSAQVPVVAQLCSCGPEPSSGSCSPSCMA